MLQVFRREELGRVARLAAEAWKDRVHSTRRRLLPDWARGSDLRSDLQNAGQFAHRHGREDGPFWRAGRSNSNMTSPAKRTSKQYGWQRADAQHRRPGQRLAGLPLFWRHRRRSGRRFPGPEGLQQSVSNKRGRSPNDSAALDADGDGNVGASGLVSFREHYLTVLQGLPRVVTAL